MNKLDQILQTTNVIERQFRDGEEPYLCFFTYQIADLQNLSDVQANVAACVYETAAKITVIFNRMDQNKSQQLFLTVVSQHKQCPPFLDLAPFKIGIGQHMTKEKYKGYLMWDLRQEICEFPKVKTIYYDAYVEEGFQVLPENRNTLFTEIQKRMTSHFPSALSEN